MNWIVYSEVLLRKEGATIGKNNSSHLSKLVHAWHMKPPCTCLQVLWLNERLINVQVLTDAIEVWL